MISNAIQQETGTEHVGVYVSQHMVVAKTEALEPISSLTQTTVLRGLSRGGRSQERIY